MHLRRSARDRYAVDADLIGTLGDLVVTDVPAIRRLAARIDASRPPGTPGIGAGEIAAVGLLHEVGHLVIRHRARERPSTLIEALEAVRRRLGTETDQLFAGFDDEFVGPPDPRDRRPERTLEELLLTRIINENPAIGAVRELVDDRGLARLPAYPAALESIEGALAAGDGSASGDGSAGDDASLIDLLRSPARAAPTSLAGQLRYVRTHFADLLGDDLTSMLAEIDLAIGTIAEEERYLHRRFGAGTRDDADHGFQAPSLDSATGAPEAFSADSAWMPGLVLIAKSTYVWLDQLSRRHARDIRTLDAIPDEELDRLAGWGITGLWLIGLWQRSVASERIKRMRGNADAVASAYSIDDYRIADDLGGEPALERLRDRAWVRGIRLASDMVPNHMGIDSRWVIEHPEWFLSVPEPPYPAYSFTGPDLSPDDRVGVVLEDHYWDDSDAAVVFKRFDRMTGDERYIYHGNDGTSFPWNDTAQLDFLRSEVREQVIRAILDVARRFPVIRFDAAMVLAKRHVRRLWWPAPGDGDAIPSRSRHAMSSAEFDALMPVEFWREVVDRVAQEVPGTLLLAEAFWMLEGYFVRSLGMHRVYNSAFMHMLRDENGPGYRALVQETLDFDPEILKRYVNFMTNPDEKSAIEQFGVDDKYFGVAMVMATMPGLPMLGHGQVEGFREQYGMEFRRAMKDEQPDEGLVERHERELIPLLRRRSWFAEARDFRLLDLVTDDGAVDEHVIAYANGSGETRSLVVYHDQFATTSGAIRGSSSGSLGDALALSDDPDVFVTYRDVRSGLEYVRSSAGIRASGLRLQLDAYRGHCFWEFDEVRDSATEPWRRLAERLDGHGVASLDDALRDIVLEPVHSALRAALADGLASASVADPRLTSDAHRADERSLAAFLEAVSDDDPTSIAEPVAAATARWTRTGVVARTLADPAERAALVVWALLAPLSDRPDQEDRLRLTSVLEDGLQRFGLDGEAVRVAMDRARVLVVLPRPSKVGGDRALVERWLVDDVVRSAIGVNTWDAVEWLDAERFESILRLASRVDAIETDTEPDDRLVTRLSAAAGRAGYRLDVFLRDLGPTGTARP